MSETLKDKIDELIEALDYFRLLTNNDKILEKLDSIDRRLIELTELLREVLKKGYIKAEIEVEGEQ